MCRWHLAVALLVGGLAATATAQQTPCPQPTSTFDLIQRGIFEQHSCTQNACHGAAKLDGLDLRAAAAYDSLLEHNDQSAAGETDSGPKAVDPGHPEGSELWLALAAKTLGRSDPSITPMPMDALPISSDELEGVRLWILAGAPQTGFVNGVAGLINACPQTSNDTGDTNLPLCRSGDPLLQLPDLHADPPADVQVIARDGHRYLEFTSSVANTGDGPLIVQAATPATHPGQMLDAQQVILRADGSKCVHPAGLIGYQETGQTWAYAHLATYELRKDDPFSGDLVAQVSKTAYCLLDTDPIRASDNRPIQYEAHCTDTIGRMGISVGYKDVYHRFHPGQWIDLDADPEAPVEPGQYYLVNIANPADTLWEMNNSAEANAGYRSIRIALAPPATPATAPQPTPQPTPQPSAGTVHAPHAPHPAVVRPTRAPRPVAAHPSTTVHQPRTPQPERTPQAKHPLRTPRPRPTPRPKPTPRPRPTPRTN
ncbi:MAG TPA: lysyl oxidase family protein [Candidatus Margulisiibacteriota bacterium]|nr:lysyl oxidase family protein [Candidatus Margulisiibacteriota bacterium]